MQSLNIEWEYTQSLVEFGNKSEQVVVVSILRGHPSPPQRPMAHRRTVAGMVFLQDHGIFTGSSSYHL